MFPFKGGSRGDCSPPSFSDCSPWIRACHCNNKLLNNNIDMDVIYYLRAFIIAYVYLFFSMLQWSHNSTVCHRHICVCIFLYVVVAIDQRWQSAAQWTNIIVPNMGSNLRQCYDNTFLLIDRNFCYFEYN
jgi:hypothetical protein